MTLPTEKRPTGKRWSQYAPPGTVQHNQNVIHSSFWIYGGSVRVISTVTITELPDGAGFGPHWHISVSNAGRRASDLDVRRVLYAFGLQGAEEDNHHPSVARHFWMPVDPAHRVDCGCKTSEVVVTDPDGFRWTTPKPGEGECRGCEYARWFGKPCATHGVGQEQHGSAGDAGGAGATAEEQVG